MQKHILAIGAHPGDMEISCGAVLAAHRKKGNKVTIIHLTSGSDHHLRLSKAYFQHQLKIAAEEAAYVINAKVITDFLHRDRLVFSTENCYQLANLLRSLNPTSIITHWKYSIQPDHRVAHQLVCDALTYCESSDVKLEYPAYPGVKGLYFTENWEDKVDFEPFIYVDVTKFMSTWFKMVSCYEQFKYKNNFYINYYQALAEVRGKESHFEYACVFNSYLSIKQSLDILP